MSSWKWELGTGPLGWVRGLVAGLSQEDGLLMIMLSVAEQSVDLLGLSLLICQGE